MADLTPSPSDTSGTTAASTSSPAETCRRRKTWPTNRGSSSTLGTATTVADREELDRIDALYAEKYVDPHSGAHDSIFHDHAALYRVDIRHVMAWEYGVVATRTDWRFPVGSAEAG